MKDRIDYAKRGIIWSQKKGAMMGAIGLLVQIAEKICQKLKGIFKKHHRRRAMSKDKEPAPFIPTPTPPQRDKGKEYHIYEYITAYFPKTEMLDYLNKYGAEGWQLVHLLDEGVRAPSTGHGTPALLLTVLFMRVKP